jgi:hypothetical protein
VQTLSRSSETSIAVFQSLLCLLNLIVIRLLHASFSFIFLVIPFRHILQKNS